MADISILQLPSISQVDLNDFTIVESLLDSKTTKARVSELLRVTSVNGEVGDVVLDPDDLDDSTTTNKWVDQNEKDKIAVIETTLSNEVYLNGQGNYVSVTITGVAAADVTYDNAISELGSTNVQGAIDELDSRIDEVENPTIDATIQSSENVTLTYSNVSSTSEVGTNVAAELYAVFYRGLIENGDGSTGPNLVGDPNNYSFSGPGIATSIELPTSDTTVNVSAPSYELGFESVNWNVVTSYDIGTGTYYDSQGDPATNLDADRVAADTTDNSPNVTGRYYAFYGVGSIPTNSTEVRALDDKTFMNGSNAGSFTILIPEGEKQIAFSIPTDGQNVVVLMRESSNADVTSSFTINTFNVEDAGGNLVSYDNYGSELSGIGYNSDIHYDITIG